MSGSSDPKGGSRLEVRHRTTFHYAMPVTHSANTLRLEPRTFPYQKTLSAFVKVLPATRVRRFADLFENITHHFELQSPHTRLVIESHIRVHNLPLDIPESAFSATTGGYHDSAVRERVWPYFHDSGRVVKSPEIWRQAVDLTDGIASVHGKAKSIMEWIHAGFRYDSAATEVNTRMEEAFAGRHGVCQDFTHVMLGMCRSVGLAARYASGYLYNGPLDHLVGAQASHAWCEVYLPGAGWIGFDPTNNTLADERYVKVAVGRDYDDVAPVTGTYVGTSHCRMEVEVEVGRA